MKHAIRNVIAAACFALAPAMAVAQEAAPAPLPPVSSGDTQLRLENFERAYEIFSLHCEAGEPRGCRRMGDMHRRALGRSQDYDAAVEAYDRACTLGSGEACMELGNMYFQARGVEEDFPRARALYTSGCELGEAPACGVLGNMLYSAMGGPRDRERGADLLRQSCRDGVVYSCNQIQSYGIRDGAPRTFSPWEWIMGN